MTDERYNGWTNRETCLIKLWIDNEQGDSEYWQEQTARMWNRADPGDDRSPSARSMLEDALRQHFDDAAYELLDAGNAAASFWADLMGTALGRVNWREIAAAMLQDAELEGYEPAKERR